MDTNDKAASQPESIDVEFVNLMSAYRHAESAEAHQKARRALVDYHDFAVAKAREEGVRTGLEAHSEKESASVTYWKERAEAALAQQGAKVPEGWKLVPRQLTEEQSREIVYNINRKYKGNPMSDFLAREVWKWGMYAAPAAPVAGPENK